MRRNASRHSLFLSTVRRGTILLTVIPALVFLSSSGAEEPVRPAAGPDQAPSADKPRAAVPTVEEARRQAEVLHTAMHAALQVVHHRYYREDAGLPIPAAILDEIFAQVREEKQVGLRWLAVEGQAMNTDHKPQDQFEHDAVRALKSGQGSHEQLADGVYRRAGAIALTNHCLKCHVPDRKSTENRTAGLIVSIPVGGP